MCPDFSACALRVRPRNLLLTLILVFPLVFLSSSWYPRVPLTFTRISPEPAPQPISSVPIELPSVDVPRILLVSAFYPLAHSKHSLHDYKQWLRLFLGRITTDTYLFTLPEWEPIIRELRGDLPIVINTTFASPFDIPPLHGKRQKYEKMHAQDREAHIHSPELYAVWSTKSYFLREGLRNSRNHTQFRQQSGKEYRYAFWADAGTFRREHLWKAWPDPARVEDAWAEGVRESGMKAEDIIFFPVTQLPHQSMKFWREDMGPIDNNFSEGSFFGGMSDAIDWWYNLYFSYHDHWLDNGFFVGKDQTLFNALFLLYPSRFICVWFSDPIAPAAVSLLSSSLSFSSYDVHHPPPRSQLESPLGQCLNFWYYYLFFFGSEVEREKMANRWLAAWRWMWPWEWVQQMQTKKEPCRLTRVLAMESALKRVFGEEWGPPTASLTISET